MRKLSKEATRRLRRFRADEVARIRADGLRFGLSESIVMQSIRREARAIIGDLDGDEIHFEAGELVWVKAGGLRFYVDGNRVEVRKI